MFFFLTFAVLRLKCVKHFPSRLKKISRMMMMMIYGYKEHVGSQLESARRREGTVDTKETQ